MPKEGGGQRQQGCQSNEARGGGLASSFFLHEQDRHTASRKLGATRASLYISYAILLDILAAGESSVAGGQCCVPGVLADVAALENEMEKKKEEKEKEKEREREKDEMKKKKDYAEEKRSP